jgi:L-threonylcarbamoyladenylate synthase
VLVVSGGAESLDRAVRKAVEVLHAGGVLGHPTDTVYGIGGAARADVDRRVAGMKMRSADDAPILRIGLDSGVIRRAYPDLAWPATAERLASRFWPGALTLILTDDSGSSVAVRVEGHPVTRAVLDGWGAPIGSTSLNLAGAPPAVTSEEARGFLAAMPDPGVPVLLLDCGELAGPPPSTMVSFVGSGPTVLREGAISREAIADCLQGREPE